MLFEYSGLNYWPYTAFLVSGIQPNIGFESTTQNKAYCNTLLCRLFCMTRFPHHLESLQTTISTASYCKHNFLKCLQNKGFYEQFNISLILHSSTAMFRTWDPVLFNMDPV
jgi:hypothetical protein